MTKAYHRSLMTIIGPLATLATLAIISLWSGLDVTVALAFVPLVWSATVGGLAPALASATAITVYTAFVYRPDYLGIAQVTVSVFVIAWMVGYLRHRAELAQKIDDNMRRLKEAVEIIRDLKTSWLDLSDAGKHKMVDEIEDRLGNLAALVFGWQSIGEEMQRTKDYLGLREEEE